MDYLPFFKFCFIEFFVIYFYERTVNVENKFAFQT